MPWIIKDVEKHKKGLSLEQKKKWIAVANKVLRDCLADGKSEVECDAKAIRIANAAVETNSVCFLAQANALEMQYKASTKMWKGEEYLVVPVVMMVEGVHSGSRGAVFHSTKELEKSVSKWDGLPVTLSHPQIDGHFVSANTEDIIQDWGIGHINNTHMDGMKLKAEAWVNVQKITALSPSVLYSLQNGEMLEVSIGLFSDEDGISGIWKSEEYISSAFNYLPDHLALLPGETGACSVMDGCGVRVNTLIKKKGELIMCEKCKEKAQALIANENTLFDETDLEWLETLTEDKLDKLIPKVKTIEKVVEVEVNVDVTKEKALEVLGIEKEQYEKGLQIHKERKNEVVKNIMSNTNDVWTDEVLEAMDLETLEKIEKSIKKQGVYVAPPAGSTNDVKIRPLAVPGVEFEN